MNYQVTPRKVHLQSYYFRNIMGIYWCAKLLSSGLHFMDWQLT